MEITRKTSIYTKVKCRSYSFADLTGFTELLNDCRVTHDSEESSAKRRIRFANPRKASFNQVQQFHTWHTISTSLPHPLFSHESRKSRTKEAVRSACGVEFSEATLGGVGICVSKTGPRTPGPPKSLNCKSSCDVIMKSTMSIIRISKSGINQPDKYLKKGSGWALCTTSLLTCQSGAKLRPRYFFAMGPGRISNVPSTSTPTRKVPSR